MGEEKDLLERVSTLEEQVRGMVEIKTKIDNLYNLMMEIKLENAGHKSDYATKIELGTHRKEIDNEIEKLHESKQKIFWTFLSTGLVFTVWLIEQLLHVSIHLG